MPINIKKLRPTKCNICGGEVEYIPNKFIYGKSYGSGFCYHCCQCGAYVGTHKIRPQEAFGILARERKMRGNEILLVYFCRWLFCLRKRFFKTGIKS